MTTADGKATGAAGRIDAVQTPIIPTVAELIRANPGTISLGQGVVHYPAPAEALRAMGEAMARPVNHLYGHVAGIPPLRDRLRTKLASENGMALDAGEQVVVTAGGNMAFVAALLAVVDPGDEVVLLTPYYFNHEMAVRMADARPVLVATDAGFQPDVDAVERAVTERTRAVVTISPNNPTGAVYEEATLRAINDLCRERGLFHIHDEAYEYFTYDGARHVSPGAFEGAGAHTITLFSMSKAYAMAGWRAGYMVIPGALLGAVKKVQDTVLICPPLPSQHAALGALEAGADYCRRHLPRLDEVRRLALDALGRLGGRVTVPPARGAFYLFARLHTDLDDLTIVRRLVEEHGVAAIPGSTFGETGGPTLRIAYGALEKDTAAEALTRLTRGLGAIVRGP